MLSFPTLPNRCETIAERAAQVYGEIWLEMSVLPRELAVEGSHADAEELGGFFFVAAGLAEHGVQISRFLVVDKILQGHDGLW